VGRLAVPFWFEDQPKLPIQHPYAALTARGNSRMVSNSFALHPSVYPYYP
jgi:hypothetical protein